MTRSNRIGWLILGILIILLTVIANKTFLEGELDNPSWAAYLMGTGFILYSSFGNKSIYRIFFKGEEF